MGISETCVIERDPGTYNVVTLRALCDVRHTIQFPRDIHVGAQIFCLVRAAEDPQKFLIQYNNGDMRTYLSTDRCACARPPLCDQPQ